jgi:hypothetical protein
MRRVIEDERLFPTLLTEEVAIPILHQAETDGIS